MDSTGVCNDQAISCSGVTSSKEHANAQLDGRRDQTPDDTTRGEERKTDLVVFAVHRPEVPGLHPARRLLATHFRSREGMQTTITRCYEKLYNEYLPQRALDHHTPLQAMRAWREKRPDLFVRKPQNQAELDN